MAALFSIVLAIALGQLLYTVGGVPLALIAIPLYVALGVLGGMSDARRRGDAR